MFDIVVAAAPRTPFSQRIVDALKIARLRVIACELAPGERPPSMFRVDAAVACASLPGEAGSLAAAIRASLEGPPPVVAVTRGATTAPAATVDVLDDDAPASVVVSRVQRAAANGERRRSKILLQGDLANVGARELLSSLSSRRRSCVVKIHAGSKRAEIALETGRVVHARADGVASTSADVVLTSLASWTDATFEVHGTVELPSQAERVTERPAGPAIGGGAADVALAAAVMNAVASYARAFLPLDVVALHLESARSVARRVDAGVDAFEVSHDGVVSVARVTHAKTALPDALAAWCLAFFDECSRAMPLRFRKDRVADVLGGLTRLIEQVGWGAALLPKEVAS